LRPFRKARTGPVLTNEESARQGRVVKAAQAALGSVEAVRDFLNSHHDTLGGRPIDLAVASDAGLAAVEAAMAAQGRAAAL
jgi:uncharacterized protein (DUF2384 family)